MYQHPHAQFGMHPHNRQAHPSHPHQDDRYFGIGPLGAGLIGLGLGYLGGEILDHNVAPGYMPGPGYGYGYPAPGYGYPGPGFAPGYGYPPYPGTGYGYPGAGYGPNPY